MSSPQSVAVVGGGIIGLAVARETLRRRPGTEVIVFEKEDGVARHQTGHNSGVIHAGLYYQPGSLKATLTARGRLLLTDFCDEYSVPVVHAGKLVVALNSSELEGLDEIERRAVANCVPGLRRVGEDEMHEIEPHVQGIAALHSPATAVVDYRAVAKALAEDVVRRGGTVQLGHAVTEAVDSPAGARLVVADQASVFDQAILCAGLGSDAIAAHVGTRDLRIIPFRGEYFSLTGASASLVRALVYPVPDPKYPFLGVHFTRGVDNEVHVGPNAVLALALEGYRWSDVRLTDLLQTLRWPGFWHLARQNWQSGTSEIIRSISKRLYVRSARAYFPDLHTADVVRAGSGVRAQATARDGALIDDFVIDKSDHILAVRNAPSPAATASLAIAEHILDAASIT
ncbi:MAG: hydroxyglutarate oxidase [Pseudonocardiales bacterium]|nr:hydroxyglutarate oxidase [Pseudonocardiales bacterium]